eukprot:SAG11_NODE_57_length_19200_cov_18.288417_5_plen_119_part_00
MQCIRFISDADGQLTVGIRFFRPKQRHHLPVAANGYTDWVDIGAVPDTLCFATLLREYFSVSALLPRFDDDLFITERTDRRKAGKYWGLSADRPMRWSRLAFRMSFCRTQRGTRDRHI